MDEQTFRNIFEKANPQQCEHQLSMGDVIVFTKDVTEPEWCRVSGICDHCGLQLVVRFPIRQEPKLEELPT